MAQFFGSENIPSPVVASTTTLTLAATNLGLPTVFLVGGQAYTPSGTITLNTATTGANGLDTGALSQISLYYIYAIVNNSTFVPALVASLAVPSTGPSMPSGYGSAFKLVGAFYTNGSSQVGSIVPIVGPARTAWMSYDFYVLGYGGSNPTFGTHTKRSMWRRDGDCIEVQVTFTQTTAGTVGASIYGFGFPTAFTVNQTVNGVSGDTVTGSGIISVGAPIGIVCQPAQSGGVGNFQSTIQLQTTGGTSIQFNTFSFANASYSFMYFARIAVNELAGKVSLL
jgi:hypothetical protein